MLVGDFGVTEGFAGVVFGFAGVVFGFAGVVEPAGCFAFAAASAFAFAAAAFAAAEPVSSTTFGLPVILSIIIFVPAPSTAPVSAFTTLLVVEFVLVVFGLTTGFTTDVGDVVLVVGVVDVFVVTVGLVVVVGFVVIVGFVVVGFVVTAGFVVVGLVVDVSGGFVVIEGVVVGFVVVPLVTAGLVVDGVDVIAPAPLEVPLEIPPEGGLTTLEPPEGVPRLGLPPEIEGSSSKLRITLPRGARSIPLASGSCLLDVRFLRIAIFILPSSPLRSSLRC
jgi:hypothetical protein